MKTGLVLEGGGMRGLYTGGVLDCLMDQQIQADYVIGVSAGACNGVSYVSGQRGRNLRINTEYVTDKRYVGLHNLLHTGSMFGMDFIFDEIPHKLDPFDYTAFLASPCEFIAGVTDVLTGKPAYFGREDMQGHSTVLRASSAIPCFSPMVRYKGRDYLDGGTSDPIPVRKALADGCDKVLVVLTRERGFVKKPEQGRAIYRRKYKDYPAMIEALDRRHEIYNETLAFLRPLEAAGTALVIAPAEPLGLSRFEKKMENLKRAYETGYADTERRMGDIRAFLSFRNFS